MTGSVPAQSAPVGRVESQPLPQQAAQPSPPPSVAKPATVATAGITGGGRGIGSYQPPAYNPAPYTPPPARAAAPASAEITGSVAKRPAQWKWEGGTAVIVGQGENLDSLARKYRLPAQAILQANGIGNASGIRPGQRIVIPRYSPAQPNTQPAAPARQAANSTVHVVAPGETMISISRKTGRSISAIAAANNIAPHAMLKIGDQLIIPGGARSARRPATPQAAQPKLAAAPVVAAPRVVSTEPTQTARLATPAGEAVAEEPATGSSGATSFRWPVRGRVIAGFGPKANGQQNDGINLAVPQGTIVRAADDGVVAYAGNELKGYGNLILVRHSNGYVTAYAHASEIMVKRNDPVRRGQVIAKSGQTGTVTSPQLHFEIRKGSTPVDPMPLLPAGA